MRQDEPGYRSVNRRTRAQRIDRATLRAAAAVVTDPRQRDEMAGPSYLHRLPFVRMLFWQRLDAVAQFLDVDRARYQSGLDFGCGLGVLLPTLSRATRQLYASDLITGPARQLASTLGLNNIVFMESPDLRDVRAGSLDYVVSADVLEHVDDLPAAIETLRAALRVGGSLVVSGPTENALYKAGRLLAGFGGKGGYHHSNIHLIHDEIIRPAGRFQISGCRVLPLRGIVEAFYIYAYTRLS